MTAMNFKMINSLRFNSLFNWSVHYTNSVEKNYSQKFPLKRIGDFLLRDKTPIEIQDDIVYKRVKIRINGGGISVRDKEIGKEIGTKSQFLVKLNQFLLSKIDARNGAFGVVPVECEGAIITGNFWTFDVDYEQINPHYLKLFTSTKHFQELCQRASNGTTNRNYLQESLFLNMEVPLPDVDTQNQLVNQYNKNLAKAQRAENQANELEKSIESYLLNELGIEKPKFTNKKKGLYLVRLKELRRWGLESDTIGVSTIFPSKKISSLIEFIGTGTTPPTNNAAYFDGDVDFFTPSDLGNDMYLLNAERKVSKLALEHKKVRAFEKDTLLFVGIGSSVGKVGIVKSDLATSNQQLTGLKFNDHININFIYYFFNYFKEFTVKEQSKTTIPIVNQKNILNIQIPVPSKEIQTQIVNHITTQKEQIRSLRQQAEKLRKQAKENFEKEIFVTT